MILWDIRILECLRHELWSNRNGFRLDVDSMEFWFCWVMKLLCTYIFWALTRQWATIILHANCKHCNSFSIRTPKVLYRQSVLDFFRSLSLRKKLNLRKFLQYFLFLHQFNFLLSPFFWLKLGLKIANFSNSGMALMSIIGSSLFPYHSPGKGRWTKYRMRFSTSFGALLAKQGMSRVVVKKSLSK